MNIAILSKADASGGGASRVAQDLCLLLNAAGHTAHHYVGYAQHTTPYLRCLYGNFFLAKLIRRLNLYSTRLGFPDLIPWELPFFYLNHIRQYDLIHFHDLSSAISPLTVRYLARRIPTVWTFHDCSPFTGGCLYPMGCQKYRTRCGQCPQLGQWPIASKFDFTGFMQNIKRRTAAELRFTAVTPSRWMAEMALSSGMFDVSPEIIWNGVDISLFRPQSKMSVRYKLDLPTNRPIILMMATNVSETRKGVLYALQSLARIKFLNPLLLLIGHFDVNGRAAFAQFDTVVTGYISDSYLKADYLAVADVFLFTSLADNLPLVVLETMATATPTVGFATGGVPEMVEHNRSGYLVPPGDVDGLVQGLKLALLEHRAEQWGQEARRRVEKYFSHQTFLDNHLKLYETVIRNFKR